MFRSSRWRPLALGGIVVLAVCVGAMTWRSHAVSASVRTPPRDQTHHLEARRLYTNHLRALDSALVRLATAADQLANGDTTCILPAFHDVRYAYKRAEPLAEYYAPVTVEVMNGPALDRPDDEDPFKTLPQTGMQLVESWLYPRIQRDRASAIRHEAAALRVNVKRLVEIANRTWFDDAHLFDAARLELGRVVALGLANFDAPASGDAIAEARAALDGVRATLLPMRPVSNATTWTRYEAALRLAAAALDTVTHADRFDRLTFITRHVNPLGEAIGRLQDALGVPRLVARRAWRTSANTLFEDGAWDVSAYAPLYAPVPTPALIALGKSLFFDPRLSANGTRSCASCHSPAKGFTDGLPLAALVGTRVGTPLGVGAHAGHTARNTPTIMGVGLQPAAFADLRVSYLEDQVTDVIGNAAEMGGGVGAAAIRLAGDATVRQSFVRAFGEGHRPVTPERLRLALAAYMRSLTPLHTRFDHAVRGDTSALSPRERLGFTVFMGKGRCGTCHFAPLFNGATPPGFTEMEVEVIGAPSRAVVRNGVLDPDVGRERVDRAPLHRHAFKTPTLRNVALTAPYMHNGAYPTLESVVDFYNRGGGMGIGAAVPNQTLPPEPLHLTSEEQEALVAFLKALTDTAFVTMGTSNP